MKLKKTAAILAAVMSLSAAPAAFAQTDIAPVTGIESSNIGELNILNNIYTYGYGSGASDGESKVIAPTTIINGLDAAVVNVINTIVSINIDMSDMSSVVEGIRADIMNSMMK